MISRVKAELLARTILGDTLARVDIAGVHITLSVRAYEDFTLKQLVDLSRAFEAEDLDIAWDPDGCTITVRT